MSQQSLVRTEQFPTTGPLALSGVLRFADLEVTAHDDAEQVVVEIVASGSRAADLLASVELAAGPGTLAIVVPSSWSFIGARGGLRLRLTVPSGSRLDLAAGSGDLAALGRYAEARLRSGSGDVRLERAVTAEVRCGSGDVVIGEVGLLSVQGGSGDLRLERCEDLSLTSGSGEVTVGAVLGRGTVRSGSGRLAVAEVGGDLEISTGSGGVSLEQVSGTLRVRSGSGDVRIARAVSGSLAVTSGSGRLRLGIPHGTAALLDASSSSGAVRSELDQVAGADGFEQRLEVRARSSSGSITISRAA